MARYIKNPKAQKVKAKSVQSVANAKKPADKSEGYNKPPNREFSLSPAPPTLPGQSEPFQHYLDEQASQTEAVIALNEAIQAAFPDGNSDIFLAVIEVASAITQVGKAGLGMKECLIDKYEKRGDEMQKMAARIEDQDDTIDRFQDLLLSRRLALKMDEQEEVLQHLAVENNALKYQVNNFGLEINRLRHFLQGNEHQYPQNGEPGALPGFCRNYITPYRYPYQKEDMCQKPPCKEKRCVEGFQDDATSGIGKGLKRVSDGVHYLPDSHRDQTGENIWAPAFMHEKKEARLVSQAMPFEERLFPTFIGEIVSANKKARKEEDHAHEQTVAAELTAAGVPGTSGYKTFSIQQQNLMGNLTSISANSDHSFGSANPSSLDAIWGAASGVASTFAQEDDSAIDPRFLNLNMPDLDGSLTPNASGLRFE